MRSSEVIDLTGAVPFAKASRIKGRWRAAGGARLDNLASPLLLQPEPVACLIDPVGSSRPPLAPARQLRALPQAPAAPARPSSTASLTIDLTDNKGNQEPQEQPEPPAKRRRQEAQQPAARSEPPPPRQQDQRTQRAPQRERQPCFICFEDEGAMMHQLGACTHSFCLPCLREYVSGKVADRAFPIPCALPDCKKPISAAECGLVLSAEEQVLLGKLEAEAAVGVGARLFCPNPKCSQLLIADDKRADTAMDCPYCSQDLCANCGVAWHAGMTCQQYQAQPGALRSREDQAVLDMAEKEGLRRCPGCGQMVERTQGCSHMKCRCSTAFCYGCGKTKSKGASHYCDCKPHAAQWLNPPA